MQKLFSKNNMLNVSSTGGPMALGILEETAAQYTSRMAFDDRRIGAAAIYCSDGRFGEQMDEFLHEGLGLPRYDRVAVPGGAACLADHTLAYYEQESLSRQLRFLIESHSLRRLVLIAHQDCGFYRDVWLGSRTLLQQQATDLEKAADRIRRWNLRVEIEAYFAIQADGLISFQRWPIAST
jgi:hypothetical protein